MKPATGFKVGDIVFVKNSDDTKYEKDYGIYRHHKQFFGKVTEVEDYGSETTVEVTFDDHTWWVYEPCELCHASEIKDMTIEEVSNKYGVQIQAVYL